ncbi:filamentous haemagglutinin family protein [Herbaspirillum robiniae]|uniref:filamentous haemagglutinin family protein n=1 Tax=Herbaspirillum robiniae TaxID=2014887 RepID=UPI003D78A18A
MNNGRQSAMRSQPERLNTNIFPRAPIAQAALLLIAATAVQNAGAQQAFSPAWFASKGAAQSSAAATGYLPNGVRAATVINPTQQQQAANAQLQRSINNLSLLARGIAAQQAAQEAARQAALANGGNVPDGLAEGGLKVDTNSLTQGWINANAPTQSSANGKAIVSVAQTADKAILNWETFNVGKNTILNFAQQAGWAVLNRVNDPLARPSQIQGQINAPGTVMIANRNGVVFTGSSQVDTRNLVVAAANISDAQFRDKGLYVDSNGTAPTFTDALGKLEVQAGAKISTKLASSATESGGYVLLLGSEVSNAGHINTAGGQTVLAAGDAFYIRRGVATDGNKTSTTRGNEVSAAYGGAASGLVQNTGLITASTGDITLTGHQVVQAGVAVSTTNVGARGTIHLSNRVGDATGSVTLAEGSATGILLDPAASSALDSQRDAAQTAIDGIAGTNNITANFDNLSAVQDRTDLPRIEIVSGNTVEFKDDSITLATGGQIAVSAKSRSLVANGAVLDVAGAVGVNLAMESNNLKINVQGNELRDASVNRDSALLNNSDVWLDRRSLVLVPAGTNGYATDRWYTAGGLLEVSGYLATGGHTAGEWLAQGGTITFAGKDVVTQSGSSINLSGGTLNVQTGYIRQSWVKGADGRLYEVSSAPGDMQYAGIYKGFEVAHSRWGDKTTEYYYNPLIAPQRRLEDGYTVGRDAGKLVIATSSVVLEGELVSEVYQGPRQTQAAQVGMDGYYQSQTAVARRGQLVIGQYQPRYDAAAGMLRYGLTPLASKVTLADQVASVADGAGLTGALPADRQDTIVLDSGLLGRFALGGLLISAKESIIVDGAVSMAKGGAITLYSPLVQVNADLVAHGGLINLGNKLVQMSGSGRYEETLLNPLSGKPSGMQLANGAALDVSGLWVNQLGGADDASGRAYLNGGTVSIRDTGDISLGQGSRVDVSSGAALLATGKSSGGKGGNLLLQNNSALRSDATIALDGTLSGYGVAGGGSFTLDTGNIQIGGDTAATGVLHLGEDFFNKGFANYLLTGIRGISVADGAKVDVTMPVYRIADGAAAVASGAPAIQALELFTPDLYQPDPTKGRFTQRKGASLSMSISTLAASAGLLNASAITIGRNASVTVDPGQSITLAGLGQITVERGAHLNAWGGNITLAQVELPDTSPDFNNIYSQPGKRSIWIGEDAVLDVAAHAVTAIDARGNVYGAVANGGSIVLGATLNAGTGQTSVKNLHTFVAVREGAVLDASGSHADIDVAGMGRVSLASRGGSITLATGDGLYLDGSLRATSGGAGAAGGILTVAIDTPGYTSAASADMRNSRELVISQQATPSGLPGGLAALEATAQMTYGHMRLGVDQVEAGGFGQLSLFSRGGLSFDGDVSISMSQSLQLYSSVVAQRQLGGAGNSVRLAAPYVRLAGLGVLKTPDGITTATSLAAATTRLSSVHTLELDASLIDVRDGVTLGFSASTFDSGGDLRFLASVNALAPSAISPTTVLSTPGDIVMRAAQLYPDSGASVNVRAGFDSGATSTDGSRPYHPDSVLRIERNGSDLSIMPYSVFGVLNLSAGTVKQGGIVRAPLGAISFGGDSQSSRWTGLTELMPGSLTSVSAKGLVIPYGGTVDGINYMFNGSNVVLTGIVGGALPQGITLAGTRVIAQPGAILDLSGGGDLTGAGFISGRGGSTDARTAPLMQVGADGRFVLPSLSSNPVYAIVPGAQAAQAPAVLAGGASDPMIGQQITIGAGVAGLPAGTYTLLPSTYALLPGAFRVELNGAAGLNAAFAATALRNGSTSVAAQLSVANTGIGDTLFRQAIVTSARTLRSYSQYNEMSYGEFVLADAQRKGVPRAMMPEDGKLLTLNLRSGAGADTLQFNGQANFSAVDGGFRGSLSVLASSVLGISTLEIVAPGAAATPGFDGVTVRSDSLNQFNPGRMFIGATPRVLYGQNGSILDFGYESATEIYLRSGAMLAAPEVILVAGATNRAHRIVIEQGAAINTIGRGAVDFDATGGYTYQGGYDVVSVSNGLQNFLPAESKSNVSGGVTIGAACATTLCIGQAELYSEGSISVSTNGSFNMEDNVRYGTRNLNVSVSSINAGGTQALADAAGRNALPPGLAMNQDLLNRLLAGDQRYGAPALETLILSARESFNFYGTTTLDTIDPQTGKSSLKQLVLNTPAIYGYGGAGDVATIRTGSLIWNGGANAAGAVVTQGPGTGSGTLDILADRIEFGYGPFTRPTGMTVFDRIALGFANVNLTATDRITANHKGSWSVYQSQGAYDPNTGYQYSGGNLTLTAPMITGEAGSVSRLQAGGALSVNAAGDGGAGSLPSAGQGAELTLAGRDVRIDGTLALPSGKLSIIAENELVLGEHAVINMAGRKTRFNDVDTWGWGGDLILESSAGNIRQAAGALIDLSAQYNRAGSLRATALGAAGGAVDLQGRIEGGSSGYYDAGGTLVPYLAGAIEVHAQTLGGGGTLDSQFAALNQRLNSGKVSGARSFQIKQGDLTIGSDIKAGEVSVSLDNGSLTVAGTIDASGERVGSIRLAAGNNLTIAAGAVLDAHGTVLRVDSYGKIIDSPNRAIVELSAGKNGTLTLAGGARVDLRHGTNAAIGALAGQNDGAARGTLTLNAFRTGETSGDVRIDTAGPVTVQGARAIDINAMWRYDDAPDGVDTAGDGHAFQIINQAYLKAKHDQNVLFMTQALANTNLMSNKLGGLRGYTDAFHFKPGVEIISKTADGDLVVQGDIDLSGYRYASVNPNSQKTAVAGSGEAGALTLRAGGDLNIYGSINDGFATPPDTQDDNGWLLRSGKEFTGSNIVVPRTGVVLAVGTVFEPGHTLNYDLPIKSTALVGGQMMPVSSTLAAPLTVAAGTVFNADVRDASGAVIHPAGSVLTASETLPAGTQFDAGFRLPVDATLAALTWPKNMALPTPVNIQQVGSVLVMSRDTVLPIGALIPAGTDIKLPGGVASVDLRDGSSGSQGKLWALAPMLPEGSQAWSMRLVAGADTLAADSRTTVAKPGRGNLHVADNHYGFYGELHASYGWSQEAIDALGDPSLSVGDPIDLSIIGSTDTVEVFCQFSPEYCIVGNPSYVPAVGGIRFSVIRTGAADMDLLAARDISVDTLYGIYTAGTSSAPTSANDPYNLPRARNANGTVLNSPDGVNEKFVNGGADSLARAWYPTGGGNLLIKAGGDISGNQVAAITSSALQRPDSSDAGYDSSSIGTWLWRQGSGSVLGAGQDQATAWWINFGSFVPGYGANGTADQMVGFTGIGTLGGGNVRIEAAGNAGTMARSRDLVNTYDINQRSQALVVAVGSTGRVGADGSLILTGGGDIDIRIGGVLNPVDSGAESTLPLGGVITGLRGAVQLQAGQIGRMEPLYGANADQVALGETRARDPYTSTRSMIAGGIILAPGDATVSLSTRSDQVVNTVTDPGRGKIANATPMAAVVADPLDSTRSQPTGAGYSWFSMWTDRTAIDLSSVGGDLSPMQGTERPSDLAVVYPGSLRAVAASGSLNYRANAETALLLAPSSNGQLSFLAHESIYGGLLPVSQSAASPASMATPFKPGFSGTTASGSTRDNISVDGNNLFLPYPLFVFGAGSASSEARSNGQPARFYAIEGDLVGVSSGRSVLFGNGDKRLGQTWYDGAQPVWMMAGRDIVSSGSPLGQPSVAGTTYTSANTSATNNLFVHNSVNDVSIVSAGRDILFSSFQVAGPGTLEIIAGGKILMENKASVNSIGPVVAGDKRSGASIVMQAGAGTQGADYAALIASYLDPANLAAVGTALASQPGKVVKTYEAELAEWLGKRYGFTGTVEQALAYYTALPAEQQRVFARQVYFAELAAGGREYNDPNSPRYGSYLRGRNMIATLFPESNASGQTLTYAGDVIMFGDAGVHTLFGGDIQMLTPGGRQMFGVEGSNPAGSAGIITQGAGNIQIYARDSILLGQSRIMSTFGGSVLAWSATGDINAGRGSKTTVVYTPPKRVYDQWGDVTLSSNVPSTGAGIATLAPIPEVPAGDIDLIAPLGTIDAGEAGIRVSGNVNIAALQVVNAANIQVQGKSTGLPAVAAVNVGALTNASAAASSAAVAAQDAVARDRAAARQNLPSVFTVRVLGFGNETAPNGSPGTVPAQTVSSLAPVIKADSSIPVQVIGLGNAMDGRQMSLLTERERRALME